MPTAPSCSTATVWSPPQKKVLESLPTVGIFSNSEGGVSKSTNMTEPGAVIGYNGARVGYNGARVGYNGASVGYNGGNCRI